MTSRNGLADAFGQVLLRRSTDRTAARPSDWQAAPSAVKRPAGDRSDWPLPTVVAARHEPLLVDDLRAAWHAGMATVNVDRLMAAAAARDVDLLLAALEPARTAAAVVSAASGRLLAAFVAGAAVAGDGLVPFGVVVHRAASPTPIDWKRGGIVAVVPVAKRQPLGVSLDAVNPEAVAWARAHAAALVVASTDIKELIRALVVASQETRIPVRDLARQVREIIGLNPRRAADVRRFEWARRAEGVTGETLVKRVARYAEAQRRSRALLIARTETIGALAHGQQALWNHALAKGLLSRTLTRKQWIVTDDEVLCKICEALGADPPVAVDGLFANGIDAPPAHPACRCATSLVLVTPTRR